MNAFTAQVKAETRLLFRNGEQLLLTLGIPVVLLVFFSSVSIVDLGAGKRVQTVVPGILALAVMSTAMVGLGIATGFERKYGVLKLLGVTPLGRPRLLAAKAATIAIVEVVQFVVLATIGYALGWRPSLSVVLVLAAVLLGTACFAGIGLTMAGRLKGEVNLAAVNGLYLLLLLFGGMVVPLSKLPGPLRAVGRILPSGALSEAIRQAVGEVAHTSRPWIILAVWATAACAAAACLFRWE
jgi:ABC-2 type transport system permease protein